MYTHTQKSIENKKITLLENIKNGRSPYLYFNKTFGEDFLKRTKLEDLSTIISVVFSKFSAKYFLK